jgi:hypothetical protein
MSGRVVANLTVIRWNCKLKGLFHQLCSLLTRRALLSSSFTYDMRPFCIAEAASHCRLSLLRHCFCLLASCCLLGADDKLYIVIYSVCCPEVTKMSYSIGIESPDLDMICCLNLSSFVTFVNKQAPSSIARAYFLAVSAMTVTKEVQYQCGNTTACSRGMLADAVIW